ncbi:hypothetical protein LguiB_024299 [Lonicera macranthoides]
MIRAIRPCKTTVKEHAVVRKECSDIRSGLCSIRIIKKVSDLAENFVNPAAALLKEKHHGVLLTGIQPCTDLCIVSAEALEYYRKVNWWSSQYVAYSSRTK